MDDIRIINSLKNILKKCSNITSLSFASIFYIYKLIILLIDNNLTDENLSELLPYISTITNLESLGISENPITGTSLVRISHMLNRFEKINSLTFPCI